MWEWLLRRIIKWAYPEHDDPETIEAEELEEEEDDEEDEEDSDYAV